MMIFPCGFNILTRSDIAYSSNRKVASWTAVPDETETETNPMPLLAVGGAASSQPGAATHLNVALAFIEKPSNVALDV